MDYGLNENEWIYDKTEVMLTDGVMMELETNSRGMIKILIYDQYFLLGISGVDHLRLSINST